MIQMCAMCRIKNAGNGADRMHAHRMIHIRRFRHKLQIL